MAISITDGSTKSFDSGYLQKRIIKALISGRNFYFNSYLIFSRTIGYKFLPLPLNPIPGTKHSFVDKSFLKIDEDI